MDKRLKRKLKKLSNAVSTGLIPLPPNSENLDIVQKLNALDHSVKLRSYTPKLPIGYLGLEKRIRVTRFLPILARDDMLLYFATTYRLERFLFKRIVGVMCPSFCRHLVTSFLLPSHSQRATASRY